MVKPTIHTNPSGKQSFSKILFNPKEFENNSFVFHCGQKNFKTGAFQK